MGTLLELSDIGLASIIIPLPNTDQQENAKIIEEKGAAKIIWKLNAQVLKQEIYKMLESDEEKWGFEDRIKELFPRHGEERIVKEAMELLDYSE